MGVPNFDLVNSYLSQLRLYCEHGSLDLIIDTRIWGILVVVIVYMYTQGQYGLFYMVSVTIAQRI